METALKWSRSQQRGPLLHVWGPPDTVPQISRPADHIGPSIGAWTGAAEHCRIRLFGWPPPRHQRPARAGRPVDRRLHHPHRSHLTSHSTRAGGNATCTVEIGRRLTNRQRHVLTPTRMGGGGGVVEGGGGCMDTHSPSLPSAAPRRSVAEPLIRTPRTDRRGARRRPVRPRGWRECLYRGGAGGWRVAAE